MKLQSRYTILFTAVLVAFLLVPAKAQSAHEGGVIKGKVKERGGKSLEGVTVRVAHARKKDFTREAKTDDKGDFEVTGLETGDYSLSFEKPGYKTFTTRKLEVIGGETLKLRSAIELPRESDPYSIIRGAVLYGVGYTLPNATVTIERIDGVRKFKQETISREGGEFAFRLKAEKARYRVTASARGFQSASTEIDVESDEARNISLNLQPVK
jgi:hypothetical protein